MLDKGSALGDVCHARNASDWNATRMRQFSVVVLVVTSIVTKVRKDGIVARERLRCPALVRHRE